MGVRGLVYGVTLGSMVNSEATIASATRLLGTLPEGDARVKAVRVTTPLIIGVMQARAFPRPRFCRGLGWPLAWVHLLHPSLMGPRRAQRHRAPI